MRHGVHIDVVKRRKDEPSIVRRQNIRLSAREKKTRYKLLIIIEVPKFKYLGSVLAGRKCDTVTQRHSRIRGSDKKFIG